MITPSYKLMMQTIIFICVISCDILKIIVFCFVLYWFGLVIIGYATEVSFLHIEQRSER